MAVEFAYSVFENTTFLKGSVKSKMIFLKKSIFFATKKMVKSYVSLLIILKPKHHTNNQENTTFF